MKKATKKQTRRYLKNITIQKEDMDHPKERKSWKKMESKLAKKELQEE